MKINKQIKRSLGTSRDKETQPTSKRQNKTNDRSVFKRSIKNSSSFLSNKYFKLVSTKHREHKKIIRNTRRNILVNRIAGPRFAIVNLALDWFYC